MNSRAALSRRGFLALVPGAGAGLVIGYYLSGTMSAQDTLTQPGTPGLQPQPVAFINIDPDGTVRVWIPKSEIGQGTHSALAMVAAEELDADWSRMIPEQPGFDRRLGRQNTGGSSGIPTGYDPLRRAGATTRAMLIAAAAKQWGVEPQTLGTEPGFVVHGPTGRRASYGSLATAAAKMPVPQSVPLKDPKTFRLIGTPAPRKDIPAKVDGTAVYGLDVKVPGMLYAVILRSPEFGATIAKFDATKAKAVPGVRQIVEIPKQELPFTVGQGDPAAMTLGPAGHHHFLRPGVAVIADSTWAALEGRRALEVTWAPGPWAGLSSVGLREQFQKLVKGPGAIVATNKGDVDQALKQAAKVVEAEYDLPLLAHATMEPMNAVAHVTSIGIEVWAPSQSPGAIVGGMTHVFKVPEEAVKVHVLYSGGGFGRRGQPDAPVEAALLSRAAGAPVKVVWTREDDIQHDYYRPAGYHRLVAGLDAQNRLVAFNQREAHLPMNGFFRGPAGGGAEISVRDFPAFVAENVRLESSGVDTDVRLGPWRSVADSTNVFVLESFVDELAHAAGADPVAFRLKLLDQAVGNAKDDQARKNIARLKNVIELVSVRSGWGTPPPKGRARGIGASTSFGSYVAEVVELSVTDGHVNVHRATCVIDCGTCVNPDTVTAQMEGGIVFGISAALMGEITLKDGRVEQSNFNNYRMARMADAPVIETHLVPSTERPGGVGESAVPQIMPAITNAIFALTGTRVRRLPVKLTAV